MSTMSTRIGKKKIFLRHSQQVLLISIDLSSILAKERFERILDIREVKHDLNDRRQTAKISDF